MRRIATIAAIILLLGQTIAAAHFHRVSRQQQLAASSAAGVADSCAICAAHLHSQVVSAVVPAVDAPKLFEASVVPAVSIEPLCACVGHCFGRAPPASV